MTVWRAGVAVVAVVLALGLAACADDEPETAVEAFDEGGEEKVELVTGEPFEATAVVDDVLGPRGFYLLDTLVVTRTAVNVSQDQRVRVTGEVMEAFEARGELGDEVGDEVAEALGGGDLVVVADEVEVVGRDSD